MFCIAFFDYYWLKTQGTFFTVVTNH